MEDKPLEENLNEPVEEASEGLVEEHLEPEAPKAELVDAEVVDDDELDLPLATDVKASSGQRFVVTTGSNKDDYLDALKHINKINWMTWATMAVFVVIMIVVLLMSFLGAGGQSQGNLLLSVGLIVVALYMMVNGLILNPQKVATKLASNPALTSPGTLVIDDEGMVDSKSKTDKPVPWSIFKNIFETDRSYLLMSAASRGAYQVLPKRNFASAEEAEAFRSYAAGKLPKASLRKAPLQVFPLIMFIVSIAMLLWIIVVQF